MKYILSILVFLLTYQSLTSQVFVKADASGNNDGTSWENAYNDLDFAINNTIEGELWVAAGIYKPSTDLAGEVPTNELSKTFRLKENIAIYGGFLGNEQSRDQRDWQTNKTILSGDIGVQGDKTDNTRHVISAEYADLDQNTILDGLIIKDGNTQSQYSGAGIYVNQTHGGSFVLRNCVLENNLAYRSGGGMYVFNCDPVIEDNIFNNNSGGEGGAIYLYYSDAIVSRNYISGNMAGNGGGIYVSHYSSPTIQNNIIKGNSAVTGGGGVAIDGNYHTVFMGNQVLENEAREGGGIHMDYSKTFFFNNVVADNHATEKGGGIFMNYTPGPVFINNTIVNNAADQIGGGFYFNDANIEIINSIIYGNSANNGKQAYARGERGDWYPDFKFCNIQNGQTEIQSLGTIGFEDNVDIEPQLISSINFAYFLPEYSNMIDKGTNNTDLIGGPWTGSNGEIVEFPSTDLMGSDRVYNDHIDLGAYESQTVKLLPSNLVSVEVVGESCLDKQNGEIRINARETYNYVAHVNGMDYEFNSNLTIDHLSAGQYAVCVTISDNSDYEQCFSLVVANATVISAKSTVSKIKGQNSETIEITAGTAPYTVFLNGNQILKTSSTVFSIEVNANDMILVSSKYPCEGVYEKKVLTEQASLVYPNPTQDQLEITVPGHIRQKVLVNIYNTQQQLVQSKMYAITNNKVQISLADKPSGIYFVKLEMEQPLLYKIIKQ